MNNKQPTLAFIGAGNIANSIIYGLLNDKYPAQKIWASKRNLDSLSSLQSQGVNITNDNVIAVKHANVIILTVKPMQIADVIAELSLSLKSSLKEKTIISVAAGITTNNIKNSFVKNFGTVATSLNIIRAMPNTPCLVQAGAIALYATLNTSQNSRQQAEMIMRATGIVIWVDNEFLLDAVTAVSGSGPAYFFYFIEAMLKQAKILGLSDKQAEMLVLETGLGAIKLAMLNAQNSKDSLNLKQLRLAVTSKGGTTEAGIKILDKYGFDNILAKAINSAYKKSKQISAESY